MALVYTTTIMNARVTTQDNLEDVVKEVDVVVAGEDGTIRFELPATVQFGPADPEDFTPFGSLTEAQLVAWVDAQESIIPYKAQIALVIERELEKAALAVRRLPWQPEPEPEVPVDPAAPEN